MKNIPNNTENSETELIRSEIHVTDGFFIRDGEVHRKVYYTDILWVSTDSNYIELHLKDGKTLCAIFPLNRLQMKFPANMFMRIHRSYLVNIYAVDRFIGNRLYIGKQGLDVSKRNRKAVFACFDILEERKRTLIEK